MSHPEDDGTIEPMPDQRDEFTEFVRALQRKYMYKQAWRALNPEAVDQAMHQDKLRDGYGQREFERGLELAQRQRDAQDVINRR